MRESWNNIKFTLQGREITGLTDVEIIDGISFGGIDVNFDVRVVKTKYHFPICITTKTGRKIRSIHK